MVRRGMAVEAWLVPARQVLAWQGAARRALARQGSLGRARPGLARHGAGWHGRQG